ncbi:TadE/TadG family type IV pilus assembly protein [Candidatus Bealeia paramacronuclearis]
MIEFALISPLLFLIFFGIFEISAIFLTQASMDFALSQVVRYGRTGDVLPGVSQYAQANTLASQYSFGLIDPAQIKISATVYPNFAALPSNMAAAPTGTGNFTAASNLGAGQQIVLYTMVYDWTMYTPIVSQYFTSNGVYPIKVAAVVVNEPF